MMPQNEDVYLIWSNEHRGWWRSAGHGYSSYLKEAGHFTRDKALGICRDAIPTAWDIGIISEIPVRSADVKAFLEGQIIPEEIMGK
jgi:hypothetical protein